MLVNIDNLGRYQLVKDSVLFRNYLLNTQNLTNLGCKIVFQIQLFQQLLATLLQTFCKLRKSCLSFHLGGLHYWLMAL